MFTLLARRPKRTKKSCIAGNFFQSAATKRSPRNNFHIALDSLATISLVIIYTLALCHRVTCSPPIDYFIYTSQAGAAVEGVNEQRQANNKPLLPPLESIFKPRLEKALGAGEFNVSAVAERVLRLLRNSSHTHDNDMIDKQANDYAWHLMQQQALLYFKNRVTALRPYLSELMREAQVSSGCQFAVSGWLDKLMELEHWAALMWNSWGDFPPAGLFEGSFTDLGSYRGCLSVASNELIGQAQYCTLDFQPLVPTRPRFHSIYKTVLGVEPQTGRLTSGNFESAAQLNSRLAAHEFASSRFQSAGGQEPGGEFAANEEAADNAAWSARSLASKYSKRTIAHKQDQEANASAAAGSSQQQQLAPSSNFTLSAEALEALLQKAQYFYYVKFRIGACLPSKCSQGDVERLAQAAGQRAILQANQVNCMRKEPTYLNSYQIFAICALSLLAFVALLGTVVDLLGVRGSLADWLLPFSTWTNAKRLFDSETTSTHADLECIHGLRFFSMIWVIYGHTILYTEYQSFTHFFNVIETQIPSFILLPSLNANFSVDTFFVISGILTTYVTWEYTKGDARKFNKFAFAISRYIRLTPQLAIVILCFFLLPLFGDGPMYKQVTEDKAQVCYKNWAINLLYLQSYVSSDKHCIDPSWWLSIEMTFHLISLVLIMVMIKKPSRGLWLNALVAVALTLWGAGIHYWNGFAIQYLPSVPQRYEVPSEQTKLFFHRPYPHAASYFIGIALGYVLANRTVKKLSRAQVLQGWFLCSLGLIISLWGSYYWNLGAPYTQAQATLYYNLCQVLWPASIAWIILACSLGHGGFVDSILTAPCFVPLGRITYMTYLSHALIIYYHSASMNVPVEPSMLLFLYIFIANTFLSLVLGAILTIVYESPILNLQKKLFAYLTHKFDPTVQSQLAEMPKALIASPQVLPDKLQASPKTRHTYRSTLTNNSLADDHKS